MFDFKVQKIQFALFPKNLDLTDKIKIANDLKSNAGGIFDGEPTILPLLNDAPPEIPRIILKSKDNVFSCNISNSRIDFFLQNASAENNFEVVKKDYLLKVESLYKYFVNNLKTSIGRIGFVVNFVSKLDDSANKLLIQTVLQNDFYFAKSSKIKNISLIFSEGDKLNNGFDVNRIIQIESLRKISDPADDKLISIKYDLNTSPEKFKESNLTYENIKSILVAISSEMENNINKFLQK